MLHSQNFDKIDSFLKSVLNILILRNLIVGWREGIIKEEPGILHQIYIDLEEVLNNGRVL